MNQTNKNGIGSGIGNYLAPEILYRAKISPHTKIINIYNNSQSVLKKMVSTATMLTYISYFYKKEKQQQKVSLIILPCCINIAPLKKL